MLDNGVLPSKFGFPPLLKSCADARALCQGRALHAHVVKLHLDSDAYIVNNLIRLYAVCREIGHAHMLFDKFPRRDVVSWTTLIRGYAKLGFAKEAVHLFFQMFDSGVKPDEVTVSVVLSACAELRDLELGRKLHSFVNGNSVKLDAHLGNALVNMYSKCGDIESARKLFVKMHQKNVITWNSLITGLATNGLFKEVLSSFRRMQRAGIAADEVTLVAVLNSCANLGALETGEWVHAYIDRSSIRADGFVGNALIDMYTKCGSVVQARRVFETMKRIDVYTYTSMIAGLAMHGQGKQALNLFSDMTHAGIKPNKVTFVGVLSACSHAGLVDEGLCHFESMAKRYHLSPRIEHYGCVVDMLGRAGLLDEALELISNMPMEPDAMILNALLGACKTYGNVELGESIAKQLFDMEPEKDGSYVVMSNIYSAARKGCEAARLRCSMRKRKVRKRPGCSMVEVNGEVHEFRKGDRSHPRTQEIYLMLDVVSNHLKF